jgi:DNA polymerase I-like protein with 3'-5' exonuclease and polymerase domains
MVNNYLEENNCGNIVLQIHDELLIELIDNNIDFHSMKIKNIMEEIINNDIKLKVNIKKSTCWE